MTAQAIRRDRSGAALTERLAPYLFLSPAFLLFVIFVVAPVLASFVLAFVNWNLLGSPSWAGFHNFAKLGNDPVLLDALRNTLIFTASSIVLHVVFGTLLAIAVNSRMPRVLRYLLRTSIFFPFLISWAAVSLVWKYALDPSFGIFSYYTHQLGLSQNWLIDKSTALIALIFVDFWHTIGFAFVVLLAGLQAIPEMYYEAATVDGASAWQRFWKITVPLLSPSLFFVTVISFIGAFQIFEPMFLMTQGGPGDSTISIVQYLYQTVFRTFDVGYGAVLALVVFAIVLVVTGLQFRFLRRFVHEA
ncbi:sugar ABC transporter permease [Acidothermaceae bacterium B102]|nr:sugar ABC transporter permease [Acidothermaceae bacterium B102]